MTSAIVLGALLLLPLVIVLWAVAVYNSLIKNKNMMEEAWSGIDVQLKRRHDLIPNLVKTVEGYAQHEKQLLNDIAKYRSQSIGASDLPTKAAAETLLTQGLRQLFAVAEAYPELKANQNFLDLQSKLAETEDQLQLARRYYNGTVRNFNILVSSFPSSVVASKFNYQPAAYFEIESTDRAVPEVNFKPS
jgi:LemA protein